MTKPKNNDGKILLAICAVLVIVGIVLFSMSCKNGVLGDDDCKENPDPPDGYYRDYSMQTDGARWYTDGTNLILYTRDSEGCWR